MTPPKNPDAPRAAPLVVDLDADLLRGNLADEAFWAALRTDWRLALPGRDRTALAPEDLDVAHLPWDDGTLARLRAARTEGRPTVLTAESLALAEAVSAALGLFDATELRTVPAPAPRPGPTRPRGPVFAEAIRAMRPHQWVKNLLVFLPMIMSHSFTPAAFGWSLLAFVSFGLIASAVYLLNDLVDLPSDRRHATKRARPFASGRLPLALGRRLLAALLVAGLGLAALGGPGLLATMGLYAIATTAYSLRLKGTLGADIITLAGLYTLRIIAGAAATGIAPSMWLLSFSIFIFFSLGAVKRLAELVDLETNDRRTKAAGRAYVIEDRPVVAMIATSAGFIAVLVLALYIDSNDVRTQYAAPQFLWGIGLVLLFWISRTVLLAHRGLVDQDPVIFALTDRVSRWTGVAVVLLFIAAVVG